MDLYRRLLRPDESDRHYLMVSRICTAIRTWAVMFAQYAKNLGSLVEAVNQWGLTFTLSCWGSSCSRSSSSGCEVPAAFWAMLTGEAAIVACSLFTNIAFVV